MENNIDCKTSNERKIFPEKPEYLGSEMSQLWDATMLSWQQGVLTPLIKQELKYTILNKRIETGEPVPVIDFPDPISYPLDNEENEKIKRRQHQNKIAAAKFRKKEKEKREMLKQRAQTLKASFLKLTAEYRSLLQEKAILTQQLNDHLFLCTNT